MDDTTRAAETMVRWLRETGDVTIEGQSVCDVISGLLAERASPSSETATEALTAEERTLLQDLARGCHSTGPEMVAIAKAIRICDGSSPVPAEAPSEDTANDGASLIAAERQRQLQAEGWTPAHDDSHTHGEMAITAACYAANGTDAEVTMQGEDAFPWGSCHDKRKKHGRIRQLAIAGALIAAEIDRLSRAARSTPTEYDSPEEIK